MKKQIYNISTSFHFEPVAHKGAPYSFDGSHWMNAGEFTECMVKACMGFSCEKDANTPYDRGSDIPEINASVKSGGATLVNMKLGATDSEFLNVFFENVHSDKFIWGVVIDDQLTTYTMNAKEFRPFCENFGKINERGYFRFKKTSGKMLSWLEAHN